MGRCSDTLLHFLIHCPSASGLLTASILIPSQSPLTSKTICMRWPLSFWVEIGADAQEHEKVCYHVSPFPSFPLSWSPSLNIRCSGFGCGQVEKAL